MLENIIINNSLDGIVMDMWNRFKKWALAPTPAVKEPEPEFDSMVGEPIISFIHSLRRERNRRYVLKESDSLAFHEAGGEGKQHWMHNAQFYELLDKNTGIVYQALYYNEQVYHITNLPFSLNHWEMKILGKEFNNYREEARKRRGKMRCTQRWMERQAEWQQEKLVREEFAKQFRENAE